MNAPDNVVTHKGNTTTILVPTQNLPLLQPLRDLGLNDLADKLNAPLKRIVDSAYTRPGPTPTSQVSLPAQPAPSTATIDANATADPALTSGPLLSDSAPVITAEGGPADAAPANETGKAYVSPPVKSTTMPKTKRIRATEPAAISIGTETSVKGANQPVKADDKSTAPSEPAKPAGRPATPRPAVRGSLGVGDHLRQLLHRGNSGHPTIRAAGAGDKAATTESSAHRRLPVRPRPGATHLGADAGDS